MTQSRPPQEFEDYSMTEKLGIPTAFLLWGSGILYFGIVLDSAPAGITYISGVFFIATAIIGFTSLLTEYYTTHHKTQHNNTVKN